MNTRLTVALDGQVTPLTDAVADRWRAEGRWQQRSLRSLLSAAAAAHPDQVALVGERRGAAPVRLTYRDYDAGAHRLAAVLTGLGVRTGDAVAVMLPNWVEYPQFVFAINEVGAIYTGVPVAFADREASAILRRSKATVLVIPRRFRRSDHLAMSRRLRAELPGLRHVLVVGDGTEPPEPLGDGESWLAELLGGPPVQLPEPDPARLCYLGFTSGTTGEPKGAMHNHETLLAAVTGLVEHLGPGVLGDPLVHLVATPVGHHTGFEYGILLTTYRAGTGVYLEQWEPAWAVDVIRREQVTTFFGAPTFLQDIMTTDLAGDPSCPLRCLVIAGAPVPRSLPERASAALGGYVAPAWGLTESSIITSATPAAQSAIQRTDGSVLPGAEVRVVDDAGTVVPAGTSGNLLVRGPSVVLGYYDRPDATAEAFLPGLWFRTGDVASVDESSWVSLHGRTKDIVIRGGENIPVTDIESLIFDHPDVLNVAVIGVPDPRLGERVCAVLVLKDTPSSAAAVPLDAASLSAYLRGRGLSQHYLPEFVEIVAALPVTPSGKIQKFRLREQIIAGRLAPPERQ